MEIVGKSEGENEKEGVLWWITGNYRLTGENGSGTRKRKHDGRREEVK